MTLRNAPSDDRAAFLHHILRLRQAGEKAILRSGVAPDDILIAELAAPGSDRRCGVNLIARPSPEVAAQIGDLQEQLRAAEPGQYYYPAADLHMTVFELCYFLSADEAASLAAGFQAVLSDVLRGIPALRLDSPVLVFDPQAVALNFLPVDENLQTARATIRERLLERGIPANARYRPRSAHLTILRYLRPLQTSAANWVNILGRAGIPGELEWTIGSVSVTWGPNWYGMRSRIQEGVPYPL